MADDVPTAGVKFGGPLLGFTLRLSHCFISPRSSKTTMTGPRSVKVGVLGATGTVGQRFIALLAIHPYFIVHALGASPRSAGKPYAETVRWKQTDPIPTPVRGLVVQTCEPKHFKDCAVVFSGLDADVAGDIGMQSMSRS